MLEAILREAVKDAVGDTIAEWARDLVAKETRRALQNHEDALKLIIRTTVESAINDLLKG